jgi:uncharacterized protein
VIAYFDTSAVMPLLIAEPGSDRAAAMWDGADRVVSVRLVYPEARAALAHAERLGGLTARQLRDAVSEFDALFEQIDLVEVDDVLARRAGERLRLVDCAGMTLSTSLAPIEFGIRVSSWSQATVR